MFSGKLQPAEIVLNKFHFQFLIFLMYPNNRKIKICFQVHQISELSSFVIWNFDENIVCKFQNLQVGIKIFTLIDASLN